MLRLHNSTVLFSSLEHCLPSKSRIQTKTTALMKLQAPHNSMMYIPLASLNDIQTRQKDHSISIGKFATTIRAASYKFT